MLSAAFIRSDVSYKAITSNYKSFCYNLKATDLKGKAVCLSAAAFDRYIDWYAGHSVRDAIIYIGSLPPRSPTRLDRWPQDKMSEEVHYLDTHF